MLVRSLLLMLALVVTLPRSVSAADDPYTGAFWLPLCSDPKSDSINSSICLFYLRGIVDMHDFNKYVLRKPLWCLPDGVRLSELRLVFAQALRAKPETLHHPAAGLAITAFIEKFPCPDDDAKGPPRSTDD